MSAGRSVWLLVAALSLVVVGGLAAGLGLDLGPAQAVIAPLFVLLVPGFVILAAATGRQPLGSVDRLLFGVGLSVSLVILGGLVLIWAGLPFGVTLWSVYAAVVTALAGLVALAERSRRAGVRDESRSEPVPLAHAPLGRTVGNAAMLGLAGVIVVAAFVVAGTPAPPEAVEGYTQLWLLPRDDAGRQEVTLGVRSMELTDALYAVQLDVRGTPLQDWQEIRLAPGETWEQTVALPVSREEAGAVNASLYRLDQPEDVYRRVTLRTTSGRES